jgi:hypothetical protein
LKAYKIFVYIIFFSIPFLTQAQDSLSVKKSAGSHIKIVFNIDTRSSFVFAESINIGGLKLGIEWKNKIRTGIGGYFLLSGITRRITYDRGKSDEQLANYTLRFNYIAVYAEYVLFQTKRWEISTPVQFGVGTIYYDIKFDNRQRTSTTNRYPFIIEPTLAGHYKIYNWIGVGAGLGYRAMFSNVNQTSIEKNFNAPIYIIKVKLFLGDLYRDFQKK